MTAALAIVLILVGLPLLAWWVGGRRFWSRLRPGAEPDPWGDVVRTHRLSPSEAPRVAHAVPRGAALDEPRLRAAAVDWARRLIEQEPIRWPTRGPGGSSRAPPSSGSCASSDCSPLGADRPPRGRELGDGARSTQASSSGSAAGVRRYLRRAVERNQDQPATA